MENMLFIFAHQDDEYMILSRIRYELKRGYNVICIYLTNGNGNNVNPEIRNNESERVLGKVGVTRRNIFFGGTEKNIDDGKLIYHLEEAYNYTLKTAHNIRRIYCPSWEGGHHDHDASHLVALSIGKKMGLLNETYQFPIYNGYGVPSILFRVFYPLKANGKLIRSKLKIVDSVKNSLLCRYYRSQWKTWIALFPGSFLKLGILRQEIMQNVDIERTKIKPHKNRLYYERKFKVEFQFFMKITKNFRFKYLY